MKLKDSWACFRSVYQTWSLSLLEDWWFSCKQIFNN